MILSGYGCCPRLTVLAQILSIDSHAIHRIATFAIITAQTQPVVRAPVLQETEYIPFACISQEEVCEIGMVLHANRNGAMSMLDKKRNNNKLHI